VSDLPVITGFNFQSYRIAGVSVLFYADFDGEFYVCNYFFQLWPI